MTLQTASRCVALSVILGLTGGSGAQATDAYLAIERLETRLETSVKNEAPTVGQMSADPVSTGLLPDSQDAQIREGRSNALSVAGTQFAQLPLGDREGQVALLSLLMAMVGLVAGIVLCRRHQTQMQAIRSLSERASLITAQAREAERLLERKTLLVDEINHRVKNNFQTIISLLSTQRRCLESGKNDAASDILYDVRSRVETMAIVQQSLNDVDKKNNLPATEFISSLVSRLIVSSGRKLNVVLDVANVQLSTRTAAPLALIVNELVCNTLKHAFRGRADGQIRIGLKPAGDGNYQLVCQDNGAGLPEDFDLKSTNSFGLSIAQSLAEQICGELTFEETHTGTKWIVSFRADDNPHNGCRF